MNIWFYFPDFIYKCYEDIWKDNGIWYLKKKTTGILDLLINFYVSIFLSFCGVLAHVLLLYSVFQGDEKFKS